MTTIRCPCRSDLLTLVVGGVNDYVKVWLLSSRKGLEVPECGKRSRGHVTCLSWAMGPADTQLLAFATTEGWLVIWGISQDEDGVSCTRLQLPRAASDHIIV